MQILQEQISDHASRPVDRNDSHNIVIYKTLNIFLFYYRRLILSFYSIIKYSQYLLYYIETVNRLNSIASQNLNIF